MAADGVVSGAEGLRERVAERLSAFPTRTVSHEGLRRAAVTIVLVDATDDLQPDVDGAPGTAVVICRRGRVGSHQGQWSLPGGRIDPGESPAQAAVRETAEEVGLTRPTILGRLDDYVTRSGFHITPFVAWSVGQTPTVASPREIRSVHRFGVDQLVRDDSPRWQTITESTRPVLQLPIHDWLIHAPTAAVLYQFAEVALRGRHTRVADVEEPVFAWR